MTDDAAPQPPPSPPKGGKDGWSETCLGYRRRGVDQGGEWTQCIGFSFVIIDPKTNLPASFYLRHTHTGIRLVVHQEDEASLAEPKAPAPEKKPPPVVYVF